MFPIMSPYGRFSQLCEGYLNCPPTMKKFVILTQKAVFHGDSQIKCFSVLDGLKTAFEIVNVSLPNNMRVLSI